MRISDLTVRLAAAVLALQLVVFDPAPAQEPAAAQDDTTQAYAESLRRARDALISARDFEGALEPARLVVAALEEESDEAAAADRVMLAVILTELERFEEAELDLLNAIESLQDAEGIFSESVVTPLRLLGRSYMRARQFPQAITALDEARALSRRTAGLFNEEQMDVLDDLTTAHLGLGDTQTAHDLQVERLESAQRLWGNDDARVIPYHYELADYYQRSRLLASARKQYAAALNIALANEDDEQTLVALRNSAALELAAGPPGPMIEQLRETLDSLDASSHESGLAYAVLGDAALVEEDTQRAATYYAESWRLLDADGAVEAQEFFADPAIIRFIVPASAVDFAARSLPYSWGTITFEFNVNESGRIASITGVGADPAELMEDAYVERLMQAWFRPALDAGTPVAAEGVLFTHYFRYYVDPEEDED